MPPCLPGPCQAPRPSWQTGAARPRSRRSRSFRRGSPGTPTMGAQSPGPITGSTANRRASDSRHHSGIPLCGANDMSDSEVSPEEERVRRVLLSQRLAAVGSLAEGLAHELNNPLNCALLQLAVLKRRLELPECQPAE